MKHIKIKVKNYTKDNVEILSFTRSNNCNFSPNKWRNGCYVRRGERDKTQPFKDYLFSIYKNELYI